MQNKTFGYYQLFLLLFLLFFPLNRTIAQQNPPDILWKSIESEHFHLIFPNEIENEAQRIASTLEWAYLHDTKSLSIDPKPISMVLYNRSNTSNAYAALMPRRMGWYLTPPQSVNILGSVDWVQTLALHEYRHVVQYAKNKQHFTKFMTVLFGDNGQGMMRWSIPDWFFEGDAIVMETALSNGGRGRLPAFAMNIRTYSLTNEKFTYDQAYLGSYKRFYPSHYHLGYPLTAYGRVNYGKDLWDKVLDRTNRISWWPFAFGTSLKKYTGLNANKFYKTAMIEYDSVWQKQDSMVQKSDFKIVNAKKKKSWTNYVNPQYKKNGNIVCVKENLSKIAAFYEIDANGSEKKIENTDADIFSLNNDLLAWTRTIPDVRWGEQSFADIIIYGLDSKMQKRLTLKQHFLSPALSPDGKLIAVIEHNELQETKLVILNSLTGKRVNTFTGIVGENDYIRTPAWSADSKFIAFTHSKYNGTALSLINAESGNIRKVIDYEWDNIARPKFYKNYVLYNSDYSGIGNIFAVDLITGQRFQVTSGRFGAYNAAVSPDSAKMAYQEYNKSGFNIAEIELNPDNWIPINKVELSDPQYYKPLIEQEGGHSIAKANLPDKKYPVTDYKKMKDAIKIHSWGIYPSDPYLELGFYSNNYLNTLAISGGYLYNTNEETHGGYLALNYSKYFPVLSLVSTVMQKKDSYFFETDSVQFFSDTIVRLNAMEYKLNAGFTLPINLSRNVNRTNMSFGAGAEFTYIDGRPFRYYVNEIKDGHITPLYFSFAFSNSQRFSWRDFNPRFAQYLNIDYKKIMAYDADYEGYQFSMRSSLYFPGVLPNNSIKLGGAYEKQLDFKSGNQKMYYFSGKTSFARGYASHTLDRLYKFSADYELPLWSPDLSIGPLAYIKRIRIGGFYDYLQGYLGTNNYVYKSVGANMRFEFNIFRINYPLEIGVQYAYRINDGDFRISFLILGLPI